MTYQNLLTTLTGILTSLVDNTLTNTTLNTASLLLPTEANKTDQRFDYVHEANINFLAQQHFYQIQAPAAAGNGSYVMHALAWGMDVNGLQPVIHVFDANQNPVAVQVLTNGGGTYSLQIANATPGATYYVEVAARNPNGSNNTGNFVLGIKFDTNPATTLTAQGSGTLASPTSTSTATLSMAQNGLFHFVLAADNGSTSSSADVTMTVYDQYGNVVLTLDARTGQAPVSADLYLLAGTYTVTYSVTQTSGNYAPVDFWLDGDVLSDPQGPYYTSGSGSSTPSSGSGSYAYSGSTTGHTNQYYY
jgi:hypothetical protein